MGGPPTARSGTGGEQKGGRLEPIWSELPFIDLCSHGMHGQP